MSKHSDLFLTPILQNTSIHTWILEKSHDKNFEVNCTYHKSYQVTKNVSTTCCLEYGAFAARGKEWSWDRWIWSWMTSEKVNKTEEKDSDEINRKDQRNWLWGWSWLWLWTWNQVEDDSFQQVKDKGTQTVHS